MHVSGGYAAQLPRQLNRIQERVELLSICNAGYTCLVDGVPTAQHVDGLDRVKQELEAHRAVVVHAVLHAHVHVPQLLGIAAVAGVAVEVVVPPSHAAYPALVTAAVEIGQQYQSE
jgi:hypothetical protein